MKTALLLLLPLLSSCTTDPCAHLAECGLSVPPSECTAEVARLSCAELTAAGKADGLAQSIACAAGIVRFCPATSCGAPAPTVSMCADYIDVAGCGGCGYYACREAEGHCGANGYYLGFAQKYCDRFLLALRPRMSPAGQRFLDAGRDCLMRYVEDELPTDTACDEVKQRAFASHVACYHDNGFCELPLHDRWLLLNTVDPADMQWLTALRTGLSCL